MVDSSYLKDEKKPVTEQREDYIPAEETGCRVLRKSRIGVLKEEEGCSVAEGGSVVGERAKDQIDVQGL